MGSPASQIRLIRTAIPQRYPIQRARVLAILARWYSSLGGEVDAASSLSSR